MFSDTFDKLCGGFSGSSITKQIANMHTLFNISTTILLIPFGNYLAKLATKILPEKEEEKEHHKTFKIQSNRLIQE